MRILMFSTSSSPVGGVETWLDRCCQFLAANGMEPIVGLARGQKYNNPDRFREFHPDLNTVDVDGRGLNTEGRIRALMRCVRKVRPAIVLPMSLLDANDAVIRCKRSGEDVRLVIHAQGNLPAMLADLKHYRAGIDHVVCPGRLTMRLLTTWGEFEPGRVTHIPNGADLPTTPRAAGNASALRIGYIGRFTRGDKRVTDLIPLYHELRKRSVHFSMQIVGDGPAKAELLEAFADAPEVCVPGPMPHDRLYSEVLPQLDVLVLCSSSEAFGIVLAEAMMNGVIPVTSRYIGYHSERLVTHNETGLSFPVGDTEAAADQIERLISDPDLAARLSKNCRAHAEQNYSWQASLSRWHHLLTVVGSGPPSTIGPDYEPREQTHRGRLDALRVPAGLTDSVRRFRRFLLGSSVPAGGEEWPLFRRHYSDELINEVRGFCEELDSPEQS